MSVLVDCDRGTVGVPSTVHGLYFFFEFAEFVSDLKGDVIVCGIFPFVVVCP